jgi:hypothetical protein
LAYGRLAIAEFMENHETLGVGQCLADTGLVFEKLYL